MNLLSASDILNNPDEHPAEVVAALKELEEFDGKETIKDPFRFKGYIIGFYGIAGITPNLSNQAKKEWMEYWKHERKNWNSKDSIELW